MGFGVLVSGGVCVDEESRVSGEGLGGEGEVVAKGGG